MPTLGGAATLVPNPVQGYSGQPSTAMQSPIGGGIAPIRTLDLGAHTLHEESPESFFKTALRLGYTFVWASEVAAALAGRGTLPPSPVLLSYDDGRAAIGTSTFLSILQNYGVKINCFLTSDFLYARTVHSSLSASSPMTWDQARTLRNTGLVEFHNHTQRHEMDGLSSAQLLDSLQTCNAAVVNELGVASPVSLAYPNGVYSDAMWPTMRQAGILNGYDFQGGVQKVDWASRPGWHPMALQRSVNATNLFDSQFRTVFAHWAHDSTLERNGDNRLGFWVYPTFGGLIASGSVLNINSTANAAADSMISADYFRVPPNALVRYMFLYEATGTAGAAGFQLRQYDGNKAAFSTPTVPLRIATTDAGTYYSGEVRIDPDVRFVRPELFTDAAFNGQLYVKRLILERGA